MSTSFDTESLISFEEKKYGVGKCKLKVSVIYIWRWGKLYGAHSGWNTRAGRNNMGRKLNNRGGCVKSSTFKITFRAFDSGLSVKLLAVFRDRCRSGFLGLFYNKNGVLLWRLITEFMYHGAWYYVGRVTTDMTNKAIGYYNMASTLKYPWDILCIYPGDLNLLLYYSTGAFICSLEYAAGVGMQCLRSAGVHGIVLHRKQVYGLYVPVKLASGELRLFSEYCYGMSGIVSNPDHNYKEILGTAGRNRCLGKAPKVRGVAMNCVDHPHGGGRGKTSKRVHPYNKYGYPDKGIPTSRSLQKQYQLKFKELQASPLEVLSELGYDFLTNAE